MNDPNVVLELANVCRAVQVLALAVLSVTVLAVAPLYDPENVIDESPADSEARSFVNPDSENDDVATALTIPFVPVVRIPWPSDERYRSEANVDDAFENRPCVNPITVDVELYPVDEVNGKPKVVNPVSLLNHDRLIDDEAIELIDPPEPRYANPWDA